jgi:superoxide dismutase, Cu-Zn family
MRPRTPVIARYTLVVLMIGLIANVRPVQAGMQSGTPVATPAATPVVTMSVPLHDTTGTEIGVAQVSESSDLEVMISVTVAGMPPGEHGIHIHEAGICNSSGEAAFASAGTHYDPTDGAHGGPDDFESHAGDLGNIVIDAEGEGQLDLTSTKFSLSEGPVSLADADGSALVIHADADDMQTDPDGNSGDRIACGVIFGPMGTPEAGTPIAATPAA